MEIKDCRTLEQIHVEEVMDFIWQCSSTGADINKILGGVIYAARKLKAELKDEARDDADDE